MDIDVCSTRERVCGLNERLQLTFFERTVIRAIGAASYSQGLLERLITFRQGMPGREVYELMIPLDALRVESGGFGSISEWSTEGIPMIYPGQSVLAEFSKDSHRAHLFFHLEEYLLQESGSDAPDQT